MYFSEICKLLTVAFICVTVQDVVKEIAGIWKKPPTIESQPQAS